MPTPTRPPTDDLVQVRRAPQRGTRDRETIEAILDAGVVCHLAYLHDDRPVVVPTLYGRDGDTMVVHGSSASRAMRAGAARLPVCATVTLLDGLVLARSGFHHSANYRSVVVHADAETVEDPAEKRRALRVLTEHVTPGRWEAIRQPDERELRATLVLRLPLAHASAKVRTGGINDDAPDLDREVWAGVVPVTTSFGTPQPDPGSRADAGYPTWSESTVAGTPAAPRAGGSAG